MIILSHVANGLDYLLYKSGRMGAKLLIVHKTPLPLVQGYSKSGLSHDNSIKSYLELRIEVS